MGREAHMAEAVDEVSAEVGGNPAEAVRRSGLGCCHGERPRLAIVFFQLLLVPLAAKSMALTVHLYFLIVPGPKL